MARVEQQIQCMFSSLCIDGFQQISAKTPFSFLMPWFFPISNALLPKLNLSYFCFALGNAFQNHSGFFLIQCNKCSKPDLIWSSEKFNGITPKSFYNFGHLEMSAKRILKKFDKSS